MAKTPSQRAKKHGDRATPGNPGYSAASGNPRQDAGTAAGSSGNQAPDKPQGHNAYLIVIAGLIASAFMFWYYHLLVLGQMTQLSGGLAMPDSMVFGFSPAYVESLRNVLDADGLGQLQYVHKTAGTLFPLIFGFTWLLLIGLNTSRGMLRWLPPLAFAATQLSANVVIDTMLSAETLNPAQAQLASLLVVASWSLLVLALLSGAWVLIARGLRFRRELQRKLLAGESTLPEEPR